MQLEGGTEVATWDIKNLTEQVEAQHGKTIAEHFHSAIQSFGWKHYIASYHKEEAERIFREALESVPNQDGRYGDARSVLHAMFASWLPDQDTVPFKLAKVQTEAHTIAAAQSIHSMGDILANACYWAMRLDQSHPEVDLKRLTLRCIQKCAQTSADFSHLNQPINVLLDSREWKYLNAFVNRTKHVSLVFGLLQASFDEDRGGIKLKSFEYKGERYDKKWIDGLLNELSVAYRSLCDVGLGLNRFYSPIKNNT